MQISDKSKDHEGYLFCFVLSLIYMVCLVGVIVAKPEWMAPTAVLLIVTILTAINSGLACSRDYWIDQDGIAVRVLRGKKVHYKLKTEDIKYFGVIWVAWGRSFQQKIVFTQYRPRHNADGYSIRIRKTVAIDYTPELYEKICQIFQPNSGTVIFQPGPCNTGGGTMC